MQFVVTSVLPFPSDYNMAVMKKVCEKDNEPNPLLAKSVFYGFV